MDDFPQTNAPASQPSQAFPDSLVRAIVRDELCRQKLADENEFLRARVAELEMNAAKPFPVPLPSAASSTAVPGPSKSESLAGDMAEPKPRQESVAMSLPNADSGKSAVKASAGKIKWI